jgi:hypothetical protein
VSYRVWGLLTILMHLAVLLIGLTAILPRSAVHAAVYGAIIPLSTLTIVYSFCAKCPCHGRHCSHVVLGPLARLVPHRSVSPYTSADYWGLGLAYLVSVAYPVPWVRQHTVLPYLYESLAAVTIALILLKVCPSCRNVNCPFNRHPRNPKYRPPARAIP